MCVCMCVAFLIAYKDIKKVKVVTEKESGVIAIKR